MYHLIRIMLFYFSAIFLKLWFVSSWRNFTKLLSKAPFFHWSRKPANQTPPDLSVVETDAHSSHPSNKSTDVSYCSHVWNWQRLAKKNKTKQFFTCLQQEKSVYVYIWYNANHEKQFHRLVSVVISHICQSNHINLIENVTLLTCFNI